MGLLTTNTVFHSLNTQEQRALEQSLVDIGVMFLALFSRRRFNNFLDQETGLAEWS